MKKLLLICGLLWSALASAQFVPGQVLTAAELNSQFALYAPLTGATFTGPVTIPSLTATGTFTGAFSGTSTTQGRLDNSTSLATDAFVNQQGASAVATVPFAGVTGGIYNQATLGSGCQVVVFASGGVITSSLTISNPGSGYSVGDLMAVPAGNSDAVLRVTGVSGGGVTSVGIAYGGSGYTTGNQVTAQAVPPGRRAVVFTGTLTSNLTFIIQNGTFLTASREVEFINNTTGAFTITVKLSNGAGGSTGTGVVLPQGTSNSTALAVYTDGVNDVWLANAGTAVVGGPGAFTTLSASSTVSGAGFTTLLAPYAPLAGATFTGQVNISYSGALLTINDSSGASKASLLFNKSGVTEWGFGNSSAPNTLAVDRYVSGSYADSPVLVANSTGIVTMPDGIAGSPISGSTGSFTTLTASSTITPSQTAGIVGTTTNNNANAGSVGEFPTPTNLTGVGVTSGTSFNASSVSLTAGDWDVSGCVYFLANTGTAATFGLSSISTVSGVISTFPGPGLAYLSVPFSVGPSSNEICSPSVRESLTGTTTIYLVGQASFTGSTMTANGYLRARRVR